MDILIYTPDGKSEPWLAGFRATLPHARVRAWQSGDTAPADYVILWRPPAEVLRGRERLKAIFNMGAGADAVLALRHGEPDLWPAHVPLIRLDDAGMGAQMVEYVTHAVLRYFRRFDDYARAQALGEWKFLKPYQRSEFPVGILGLGTLGTQVVQALAQFGFPVRGWSRSAKTVAGVQSFHGNAQRSDFLSGVRVLVNMLPLTPDTVNALDRELFSQMAPGGYLINVARGDHLVEDDLLAALNGGQLAGATLDVFRTEPLPQDHPFWREPRITITPHVSALTLRDDSIAQISRKIGALERGEPVAGVVDLARGY